MSAIDFDTPRDGRQVCWIADRHALDRLSAASAFWLDTPAPDLENIREEIGCVLGRAA